MNTPSIKNSALILLGIIVLVVGIFFIQKKPPTSEHHLSTDVYPLYSSLSWNKEKQKTFGVFSGYETQSNPEQNITDLSAVFLPFEKYYSDKLTASGWTLDNTLAAGGAGSSIVAYKKMNAYIILSYVTEFTVGGKTEPAQCPCNILFSVFSTSK